MPHYPTYDIPNAAVPQCRMPRLTRNGKIEFPQKYLLKIVRRNKNFCYLCTRNASWRANN